MTTKRKRIFSSTKSRKRGKPTLPSSDITQFSSSPPTIQPTPQSQHPHGLFDSQEFFQIRRILKENKTQYLIDWEDNYETGEKYDPTWEPKANANEAAIAEWEEEQKAQRETRALAVSSKRGKGRARKITQNLATPNHIASARSDTESRTKGDDIEASEQSSSPQRFGRQSPEIQESYDASAGVESEVTHSSPDKQYCSPQVLVSDPHNCDPSDYEHFSSSQILTGTAPQPTQASQISEVPVQTAQLQASTPYPTQGGSQYVPEEDTTRTTDTSAETPVVTSSSGVHTHSVPTKTTKATIVPDSQSLPDSPSFVPSTQTINSANNTNTESQGQSLVQSVPESSALSSHISTLNHGFKPDSSTQSAPAEISDPIEDPSSPAAQANELQAVASLSSQNQGLASLRVPIHTPNNTQPRTTLAADTQQSEQDQALADVTSGAEDILLDEVPLPQTEPIKSGGSDPTKTTDTVDAASPVKGTTAPTAVSASVVGAAKTLIAPVTSSTDDSSRFDTQLPFPTSADQPTASSQAPHFQRRGLEVAPNGTLQAQSLLELNTSSSLVSPPSGFPNTIEGSAHSRPATPSNLTGPSSAHRMEPSQTPSASSSGSSYKAKMQALRDRQTAKMEARRAKLTTASPASSAVPTYLTSPSFTGSRSPSMVPSAPPVQVESLEESTHSERFESLLPSLQTFKPRQQAQNGVTTNSAAPVAAEESELVTYRNEHVLALSLSGHQKDQYKNEITYNKKKIDTVVGADLHDDPSKSEWAEQFIRQMRNIALHPDLENTDTATQMDVPPAAQAKWDENCSAKFRFLRCLFERIRDDRLHVIILSQPGRILDILETFLQGISVSYSRPDVHRESDPGSVQSNLQVTVLPTTRKDARPILSSAGLIIDLDNTADADSTYLSSLRADPTKAGRIAPLLSVIVANSVEHIERNLPLSMSGNEKLRTTVSCVAELRRDVGNLDDCSVTAEIAASTLATYLTTADGLPDWPLPEADPAVILEVVGLLESTQTSSSQDGSAHSPRTSVVGNGSLKRPLDLETTTETVSPKKPRLLSRSVSSDARIPPTVNLYDHNITHISDSIAQTSQLPATIPVENFHHDIASLSVGHTSKEAELDNLLRTTEARLAEHVAAIEDLQLRYEEQRKSVLQISNERNEAEAASAIATRRLETQSALLVTLRGEYDTLRMQNQNLAKELLNHEIPERRELEELRANAAQALSEKDRLEIKVKGMASDLEYVRAQYQDASNRAMDFAAQSSGLEEQVKVLSQKASDKARELHALNLDKQSKLIADENKKLKAMLNERDQLLKKKEDEIKLLKESRGRMNTRGNSAASTPMLSSPMKTTNVSGGSRQGSPMKAGFGGIVSRHGSPATGTMTGRHGLTHLRQ
ncbi:hypothetical protein LTR66_012394 [Elasticomyces elasticus]|nr:hypothetical protein LTR66_012394 [Elasticomyces elasticus]